MFFLVNVSGTLVRLYAIRVLGATFESPIEDVLGFFQRYRIPLLVASVSLVLLSLALDRRKGGGELESIRDLEEDME
jgi:hypothetical protein